MQIFEKIITEDENFIFDNPVKKDLKYYKQQIIDNIKAWQIKRFLDSHSVDYHEKKYRVAIAAIFKNEAPYLKEWIEFHRIIGVDHFYMYNNNSEDNGVEILESYICKGIVTLKEWPQNQAQMAAYRDAVENYKEEANWIGFIDIDEFVVPNTEKYLYTILENFKNRPAILLYWNFFCTSGFLKRDRKRLVTEDFTVCMPKYYRLGKCFYNTAYEIDFTLAKNACLHHELWTCLPKKCGEGGVFPPINVYDEPAFNNRHILGKSRMPVHINHYFSKSFQEYHDKMNKSDVYHKKNPHDLPYLLWHENHCNTVNVSAYRYLIELKLAMEMNE